MYAADNPLLHSACVIASTVYCRLPISVRSFVLNPSENWDDLMAIKHGR